MTIPAKTVDGMVSDMAASWAAQTLTTPALTDGDPLLALWQSVAVQLDFLQAQAQLVLALARAQTSTGADLDTWMAQFGFLRLPATFATGSEVFSVATPAGAAISIPVGAVVQTVGGGIQYAVVADPDDPNFDPAADAYILAAGQLSTTATVQASVAGAASNAGANLLVQFGSSLPGISSATNPAPISNGLDAETDAAFRSRFVLYLSTLAKATKDALLAAVASVQQGLLVALLENQQPGGIPLPGSFTAVIDDGSGNPPASLINAAFAALDATRAFSVQPFVIPPATLNVTVAVAVRVADGYATTPVVDDVQAAITTAVNALPPGATLYASAVILTALEVGGVAAVNPTSVLLNGVAADVTVSAGQEIKTVLSSVAVALY